MLVTISVLHANLRRIERLMEAFVFVLIDIMKILLIYAHHVIIRVLFAVHQAIVIASHVQPQILDHSRKTNASVMMATLKQV